MSIYWIALEKVHPRKSKETLIVSLVLTDSLQYKKWGGDVQRHKHQLDIQLPLRVIKSQIPGYHFCL